MTNTTLQDCMLALEEQKLAADFMADMLRMELCENKQLRSSLRSLSGQFQILLTDGDYEVGM